MLDVMCSHWGVHLTSIYGDRLVAFQCTMDIVREHNDSTNYQTITVTSPGHALEVIITQWSS